MAGSTRKRGAVSRRPTSVPTPGSASRSQSSGRSGCAWTTASSLSRAHPSTTPTSGSTPDSTWDSRFPGEASAWTALLRRSQPAWLLPPCALPDERLAGTERDGAHLAVALRRSQRACHRSGHDGVAGWRQWKELDRRPGLPQHGPFGRNEPTPSTAAGTHCRSA